MEERKKRIKHIQKIYYIRHWPLNKRAIIRYLSQFIALISSACLTRHDGGKNNILGNKSFALLTKFIPVSLSLWVAGMPLMVNGGSHDFSAKNDEISRPQQHNPLIKEDGNQRITPPHPRQPSVDIRRLHILNISQFEPSIFLSDSARPAHFRQQSLVRRHQSLPVNLGLSYRCFAQGRMLGGNTFQAYDLSDAYQPMGPAAGYWPKHRNLGVENYLRLIH